VRQFQLKTIFVVAAVATNWACRTANHPASSEIHSGSEKLSDDFKLHGNLNAFCPNYKVYDPYNSYIMAMYSHLTYVNLKEVLPILTGAKEELVATGPKNSVYGAGFASDKVRFFSSQLPTGIERTMNTERPSRDKHLDLLWTGQPLPLEICQSLSVSLCTSKDGAVQRSCQIPLPKFYRDSAKSGISTPETITEELNILTKVQEYRKKSSNYLEDLRRDFPDLLKKYEPGLRMKYEDRIAVLNKNHQLTTDDKRWDMDVLVDEYAIAKRNCEYWNTVPSIASAKTFSDTQATWIETEDYAVLAFRGTETPLLNGDEGPTTLSNFLGREKDILTDLLFNKIDCFKGASVESGFYWPESKGLVHRGFCEATRATLDWVGARLSSLNHKKKVILTGHSLGGAIATIVYSGMMRGIVDNQENFSKVELGGLYTYGSPRVGNKIFADEFRRMAQRLETPVFRQANYRDIVSRVPYFNYYHVGELHWYPRTGTTWLKNPTKFMPLDPTATTALSDQTLPISASIPAQQLASINESISHFWSLPYISLFEESISGNKEASEQLTDHKIDSYLARLWPGAINSRPGIEGQNGNVQSCSTSEEMRIFTGSDLVDEATLRK
jgi:hypothetical protein